MTRNDHDHRGEYADPVHSHGSYDVYGVAEEQHGHWDLESEASDLREDLGRAEERIRNLEDRQAALLRVLREAAARHEAVRAAGLADESYLAVSEKLAEVLAELADAIEGGIPDRSSEPPDEV